jgi:hypothetical protein
MCVSSMGRNLGSGLNENLAVAKFRKLFTIMPVTRLESDHQIASFTLANGVSKTTAEDGKDDVLGFYKCEKGQYSCPT